MNNRIIPTHTPLKRLQLLIVALLVLTFSLYGSASPALAARPVKSPITVPALSGNYQILVNQTGMYRVAYEDLKAAGLDLVGIRSTEIALTLRGNPVPIYLSNSRSFGPGEYFDFYGQALDTLYTDTNVYQIQINRKLASRISTASAAPGNEAPITYYMETLSHDPNLNYNVASPISDPWYFASMYTTTTSKSWNYSVELDQFLAGVAPISLSLDIYGGSDAFQRPDHHVQVLLNSQSIADLTFDGFTAQTVSASELPALPGANTITITLPGDTGASGDVVFLEGYAITYPRSLVATQGRLEFTTSGNVIKVGGLDTPNAVIYRLEEGAPVLLSGAVMLDEGGTYAASFAGTGSPTRYWVSSTTGLLHARIVAGRPQTDISSGSANYLIISHPDFIPGLDPLVQARTQQGYTLRVVNVEDVYNQFSFGVFDPQAIKDYIAQAYNNMGTRYVLLVGGDSYDYRDYLGLEAQSFIPTFYTSVDRSAMYSPVDPLYADVDGDRVPDLALGRFPVRDLAQLNAIIAKTLVFENHAYPKTAIFSSDLNFSKYSDTWAALLPEDWSKQFANLDQLPTDTAKSLLVDNMNTGTALVNYFGHSTTTTWTSKGLFTVSDVPVLNNPGKPFIVAQYGCWNTYFVNPRQDSLGQQFLLAQERGAAAVLGSSTNNYMDSQFYLGQYLTPNFASPGMTIGQALLSAKQAMAAALPYRAEIHLGWTILGDPAIILTP